MNLSGISLKIIANANSTEQIQNSISPTLYDGFSSFTEAEHSPESSITINQYQDITPLLAVSETIRVDRVIINLQEFQETFSRLLVYIAPLFCRWQGKELILIMPETNKIHSILASFSDMLRSLELRARGIRLISCPTCARCKTNFPEMVRSIENKLARVEKTLDVAVMGCEVNGPGEARAADIGIAFGDQKGMMFKHGEKIGVVSIAEAADVLLKEIEKL